MVQRKLIAIALALVALSMLSGCGPEALRKRGAGPGADIGNRGTIVDMHGPTNPAYKEPIDGQAIPSEGGPAH